MTLIISSFVRTVIVFVCCIAVLFFLRRNRRAEKPNICFGLFLFYLLFLFFITIYRDGFFTGTSRSLNLKLFADPLRMLLQGYYFYFIYLFVGNIIWFVPFGFLLPQLKPFSFWKTVFLGFTVSLMIESLQYLFAAGVSELDDLVLNTLGTAVGYGFYYLLKKERKQ